MQRKSISGGELALSAVLAVTIELVAMAQNQEPIILCDDFLRLFDLLALKFDDLSATHTNQVIVMLVLDLVARRTVVEIVFRRKSCVTKKFHRTIDRRLADVLVLCAHAAIEIFTRDMPLRFQKNGEDHVSLFRVFEILRIQILRESFVFEFMSHGCTLSDRKTASKHH